MKLNGKNRVAMIAAKTVIANLKDIADPECPQEGRLELIEKNQKLLKEHGHRLILAMAFKSLPNHWAHYYQTENGTEVHINRNAFGI
jgi:hypothetical protein